MTEAWGLPQRRLVRSQGRAATGGLGLHLQRLWPGTGITSRAESRDVQGAAWWYVILTTYSQGLGPVGFASWVCSLASLGQEKTPGPCHPTPLVAACLGRS